MCLIHQISLYQLSIIFLVPTFHAVKLQPIIVTLLFVLLNELLSVCFLAKLLLSHVPVSRKLLVLLAIYYLYLYCDREMTRRDGTVINCMQWMHELTRMMALTIVFAGLPNSGNEKLIDRLHNLQQLPGAGCCLCSSRKKD